MIENQEQYDDAIRKEADEAVCYYREGEDIGRAIEKATEHSSTALHQENTLATLEYFRNEPEREHYVEPDTAITNAIFMLALAAVRADIAAELKNRGVIEANEVYY